MADLFRLNIVSKRQVTIPQRLLDLLQIGIGDELHLKVANGKIVRAYPVRIAPEQRMSADAEQRFEELEAEAKGETDITELMEPFGEALEHPVRGVPLPWAGSAWEGRLVARRPPKNFRRSDERIQEIIAESLADAGMEVSDVEVSVADGEVMLRGSVPDKVSRLAIELIANRVLGVRDVHNEMELSGGRSDSGQIAHELDVAAD